ncbi:MAG: PqqD family protein [Gemmatimonadetes bacterium]|nr:PqqD family protein [Gemmatimonadota bacterium]
MGYAIPSQVLVAHLEGEAVLLHMDTKRYYRLNDTAARIWKGLERREGIPAIVAALCAEFAVDPQLAQREVDQMILDLMTNGLLTPDPVQ